MDLATFLALAIALVVALSCYFLFNDLPRLRGTDSRARRRR